MKLSVIIPVLNERRTIEQVIRQVRAVPVDKQIVVVDDGSTDGTSEILDRLAGPDLMVIHHPRTTGKGMAIRTAIPHLAGDVAIVQDADVEYDPGDYPSLLAPFRDGAQVVYGSRFRGVCQGMRLPNRIINRLLAWMANLLYRARITDEATCYKVLRTELLQSIPLECRGFEFCPEVTARVRRLGIPIVEVPISYRARTKAEGKKISWRDGVIAIWTLVKYRFR